MCFVEFVAATIVAPPCDIYYTLSTTQAPLYANLRFHFAYGRTSDASLAPQELLKAVGDLQQQILEALASHGKGPPQ